MVKIFSASIVAFLVIISVALLQQSTAESIPDLSACETASTLRTCPKDAKRLFLPRTYPARSIYVGFSSDKVHVEFLNTLLKEVSLLKIKPVVNVLVPRLEDYEAYLYLKKYFDTEKYNFLNLIPTSSKDTVWAQDYLEVLFDTDKAKSIIIDLPYWDREGEDIPTSIALACQKELIPQGEFKTKETPGNGDYGGNIEPITAKLLTVGSNMTNETLDIIKSLTSQTTIELDVDWLETGHVDELFSMIPHRDNASACGQTLLVSSPKLALDLINTVPMESAEYQSPNLPYYDDDLTWPDSSFCLHPKFNDNVECVELRKANLVYQNSINGSVEKIQEQMKKLHNCTLQVDTFPQLFLPVEKREKYGTYDDRAVALNPNSVNNIFFYPNLLLAKQDFPPFQKVVDTVLKKYSLKTIFVDGAFVHDLNGGIHCATNISYGCSI